VRYGLKKVRRKFLTGASIIARPLLHGWAYRNLRVSPIDQAEKTDIFVAGYPKSGNTWMQYLLAGVVYGVDTVFSHDSLVMDLVPDLQDRPFYRRYSSPMFFKTHFLPQARYRRVVYLLRDGRDAAVSLWHYMRATTGNDQYSLHTAITSRDKIFGVWHEHVDAWLDNPHKSEFLIIKYEDLKLDAEKELAKIMDFAHLVRTKEQIAKAVADADFFKMKAKEQTQGFDAPHWPKDKPFVRRGKVGGFRDEMDEASLILFNKISGHALRRAGYQI